MATSFVQSLSSSQNLITMQSFLSDFFHFSRKERRGIVVLLVVIVLLIIAPYFLTYVKREHPPPIVHEIELIEEGGVTDDISLFYFDPNKISLDSLELLGLPPESAATIVKFRSKVRPFKRVEDLKEIYNLSSENYDRIAPYVRIAPPSTLPIATSLPPVQKIITLDFFDPNTATSITLEAMGLSNKVVKTIINYRNKGGVFKQKEDLQKIYGLSVADYQRIAPYVLIGQEKEALKAEVLKQDEPSQYDYTPNKIYLKVEINSATIEEWQALRGIGPVYAKRIVKFREKLGGFYDLYQIKEVYGLPDSTFQQISPFLEIESGVFRSISINNASEEELKSHPYISWKQAKLIVNYRKQHGPFSAHEDLRKIQPLAEEFLQKIGAYMSYE